MRDGWDEGDNYFRRHGQVNREASLRPTPLLGSLPNPYFMSGTIEGDRANEERPEEIERRRQKSDPGETGTGSGKTGIGSLGPLPTRPIAATAIKLMLGTVPLRGGALKGEGEDEQWINTTS